MIRLPTPQLFRNDPPGTILHEGLDSPGSAGFQPASRRIQNRLYKTSLHKVLFNVCVAVIFAISPLVALAAENTWQDTLTKGEHALNQQSISQAEDYFRQALKAVEQGPHTLADSVQCINKLANALTLEDKIEEARALYQRALKLLQKSFGAQSPKLVPALFALGSIYESEGDPSAAMALYQRAFKINEKNYGPYSPSVGNSLHRLGRASYNAGQTEKAEQHYKQSLSIIEKDPSLSASKELEDVLSDYGDLVRKKDTVSQDLISDFQNEILKDTVDSGKSTASIPQSAWQQQVATQSNATKQAQTNEEQRVKLRGEIGPITNSALAPVYDTVTDVFYKQNHYEQGEPLYKRMIAIDIKALGPNHPAVADDLSSLALLYISQKRYQEAEPLLKRALTIYESVYGKNNMLVTKTQTALASVYNHLGEPNQSTDSLTNVLAQAKLTLGPNNLETAKLLNELAFLYFRQGKLEDACTFYQWALASTEGATGPQSPLVAACLKDYAQVLRSLGRGNEASQMEERAQIILANGAELSSFDTHHIR